MTYIGLTRDDLTPDEVVDPLDCGEVSDIVDEWIGQLDSGEDATLPNGNVVIYHYDGIDYSDIVGLCESKADIAVQYLKSLNDKDND